MNWRWQARQTTPTAGRSGSQAILLWRFAHTVGVRDLERMAARDEAMRRLDIALRTLI